MSAYNFTPKGAFFINYKEPDRETVDHITSLYYLIIGSLATITQTAIKDLHDNLSERKDLFKHELKYRIKEAFSRSETLIDIFKKYTTEISQYELWLDHRFYSQLNFTHILLTKLLTLAYIMHDFVPILWVKMMIFDYVFIVKNDVSG